MVAFLPPTEQLLAFKMAIEHGSFTAAASALGITQSAVSHQVGKLERSLGARLISRSARGLALTDAGEALIAAIGDPIDQLLSAFELHAISASTNLLKIQVESAFAAAWLTPRLDDYLSRFPNVRLEQYRTNNLRLSERVELAIKWGSGRWPGLVSEPLLSIYYVAVCSPAILASGRLNEPNDLANFTLLHDRKYKDWQQWLDKFHVKHANLRRGHIVDDAYILSEMAIESQGIALCSPLLVKRELTSGHLVCPFPDMRLYPKEVYCLVTRKGARLSLYAQAFAKWLKEEAANHQM